MVKIGVLLCLLPAVLMLGSTSAQEDPPWSQPTGRPAHPSLLLRGSLARARLGYVDGELDIIRAGVGIGWGRFGVIAGTRNHDFYSVGVTADAGGWWSVDLQPTGD